MIPPMSLRPSPIPVAVVIVALCLAGLGLQGCSPYRETTLSRTARQRELQAMQVARERLEREREILVRRTAEMQGEIGVARAETVRTSARLRATLADLGHELDRLQVAEQDLAAARRRAAEIEKELVPLRALEQTLRDQGKLLTDAQQRVKLLQAEVAAAEQAAVEAAGELQPRLAALRAQLEQAAQFAQAITKARDAMQAAAKALAPPKKK